MIAVFELLEQRKKQMENDFKILEILETFEYVNDDNIKRIKKKK
jgi:hypothetical protein